MNVWGSGFVTMIIYGSFVGSEINPSNAFLLLDGTDFDLLDNTVLLLLGS